MPNPEYSLSIATLFMNADIIVKSVLILLLAGSVWSWAVIIEKWRNLGVADRAARSHEQRAAESRSATQLATESAPIAGDDPASLILRAGLAESAAPPLPGGESAGERRERIERAMRLVLGVEMRRLEARLPFLATLGSAAPFIGLFGTVWGIMRSFAGIAAANNTSLSVVAPGIAEALFATAMGLAAAIPAVVAYNKLAVELGRFAGRMQGLIGHCGILLARARAEA